jgi:hypothetical protein
VEDLIDTAYKTRRYDSDNHYRFDTFYLEEIEFSLHIQGKDGTRVPRSLHKSVDKSNQLLTKNLDRANLVHYVTMKALTVFL